MDRCWWLLNNEGEEIDRAVFYCVSQNVNLVGIQDNFLKGRRLKYFKTVSTLRQSPCSSLVTFAPCPRKRVFIASSAFLVNNSFLTLSLFTHQAFKLFRLCNLPYRFPEWWQNVHSRIVWPKSSNHQNNFQISSPDKSANPNAAVSCLKK